MVERLEAEGHHLLAVRLAHGARLVRYAPPEIVFSGSRPIAADTLNDAAIALRAVTGTAWKLSMIDAPGEQTLKEIADQAAEAERQAILASPLVKAAIDAFPDAELIDWPQKRNNA